MAEEILDKSVLSERVSKLTKQVEELRGYL